MSGEATKPIGACVLVASDRAAKGERADGAGAALVAALRDLGYDVPEPGVVISSDEFSELVSRLRSLAADPALRFIVTTGGTGAAPRDVTPEATRAVVTRELPGFGELMRAESLKKTVYAAGSRATAGTVGDVLIVNLPGSPKGALECLGFVAKPARHVLDLVAGAVRDCAPVRAAEDAGPGVR
jgi:molybdenum cofactor synthesis domain-containing protein